METKIKEWLAKSGYPLELRAEKILKNMGCSVFNSQFYDDSESNIKREIDLLASISMHAGDLTVLVHLIIECKKSTHPFVLLESSGEKRFSGVNLFSNYHMDHPMTYPMLSCIRELNVRPAGNAGEGFKLVQAFSTSDETIHKAGFALSKAFYFYLGEEKKYMNGYVEDQLYTVNIPLLVIDAPFYSASLDESFECNLTKIESGVWHAPLGTLMSQNFKITIVTINHLESAANQIIDTARIYLAHLEKSGWRHVSREDPASKLYYS